MTAITAFTQYIRPEVAGCLDVRIELEVLRVLRNLCERSKIWKDDIEATVSAADIYDIDIDIATTNAALVSVEYVAIDGIEIDPATEAELSASNPMWRADKGQPTKFITNLGASTLRLYPTPTTSSDVEYGITLKPGLATTEVPDFIADQYLETIIDGTLARLLGMNEMPWTNHAEAERRRKDYEKGVDLMKHKAMVGVSSVHYNMISSTLE